MTEGWRVGTIGFAYDEWAGCFYPPGLKPENRLASYAERFNAVELDTTFYATPSERTVQRWEKATPNDFHFCLKTPQTITHRDELGYLSTEAAISDFQSFVGRMSILGDKLGCILLQFPPGFGHSEFRHLRAFLEHLPPGPKLAIEFRHKSWWEYDTMALLRRFDIAWVTADLVPYGEAGRPPSGLDYRPFEPRDTASWRYLRWCGIHAQYESDRFEVFDATPRFQWWLPQLKLDARPTYAFCGNSYAGYGPGSCARWLGLFGKDIPAGAQASLEF